MHFFINKKCLALISLLLPLESYADNARDWQNLPDNINVLFGYYNNISSNTSIDTSLPADNLSVDADLYIVRYARSFGINGKTSGIQILQPIANIHASLDNSLLPHNSHSNQGIGDTQIAFIHNLFGAPALSPEEFARWTPETFLTGAVWLTAPTGDYDKKKLLNIGGNRWVAKPELAFGYPIGPTWIEINAMASFYQDNNDYLGNSSLAQRPLYAVEGHYSWSISPILWISLDSTFSTGGETRINGTLQDNKQNNVLLGGSLGWQFSPQIGGAIAYTDTVRENSGSPDVKTWMVRLQYTW